jgi:hypothetical protein
MSKFDQILNNIKEGMSVQPINSGNSSNPGQANSGGVLQGLAATIGSNIKNNNQQAMQDFQNLIAAINTKNTKAIEEISKKYVTQAVNSPQQGTATTVQPSQ